MVLEIATLNIIPGKADEFEANFEKAQEIISSIKGYRGHQFQKCVEVADKYLLLVSWEKLEDHTIGFRKSAEYLGWKKLLHHFYAPFPVVEHYVLKCENSIK